MAELKPFTMSLSYNNGAEGWTFPVLPEEITIKKGGAGKDYNIVGKGRINTIEAPDLAEISIESFFPAHDAPYVSVEYRMTGEDPKPNGFVQDINRWMATKHPLRFVYVGRDIEDRKAKIYMAVSITNFTYWEKAGSPGDIYYKLDFKEYVFHSPKKTKVVTKQDGSTKLVAEPPKRPDFRVPPKTYTVKPGDSMWKIARMQLGDETRWRDIQKLNNLTAEDMLHLKIGRVLQLPQPKG